MTQELNLSRPIKQIEKSKTIRKIPAKEKTNYRNSTLQIEITKNK